MGVMAMKGYLAFLKAWALKPDHQIVKCHIQDAQWRGSYTICRDAVGLFYSPNHLGHCFLWGSYLSAEMQSAESITSAVLIGNLRLGILETFILKQKEIVLSRKRLKTSFSLIYFAKRLKLLMSSGCPELH